MKILKASVKTRQCFMHFIKAQWHIPWFQVLLEDEVWISGQATGKGCVCVHFPMAKGKK